MFKHYHYTKFVCKKKFQTPSGGEAENNTRRSDMLSSSAASCTLTRRKHCSDNLSSVQRSPVWPMQCQLRRSTHVWMPQIRINCAPTTHACRFPCLTHACACPNLLPNSSLNPNSSHCQLMETSERLVCKTSCLSMLMHALNTTVWCKCPEQVWSSSFSACCGVTG